MGFLKGKKILPLMLISGILIAGSTQGIEAIQKNKLIAKEDVNKIISVSAI